MSSVAHDPGYTEWESSPTVVERVSRAQDGASGALRIRRYETVGGQVRYSSVGAMLQTGEVDGLVARSAWMDRPL